MKEKTYLERIHEALKNYVKMSNPVAYTDFLTVVFEGIRENGMIPVQFFVNTDEYDGGYRPSEHEDGSAFELFTVPDKPDLAVENSMRAIIKGMRKSEDCAGLMFNPNGEYEVFIPKELLLTAIDAGYQIALDEIEAEAEIYAQNNSEHDVIWKRPVDANEFDSVAERLRLFEKNTDDFLKISFLDDRDILFAQVLRSEDSGERHLSFGYNMEDFGWDKPLVLGKELPTDDVLSILRRICVDDVSTDDIEEIMSFKSMG